MNPQKKEIYRLENPLRPKNGSISFISMGNKIFLPFPIALMNTSDRNIRSLWLWLENLILGRVFWLLNFIATKFLCIMGGGEWRLSSYFWTGSNFYSAATSGKHPQLKKKNCFDDWCDGVGERERANF